MNTSIETRCALCGMLGSVTDVQAQAIAERNEISEYEYGVLMGFVLGVLTQRVSTMQQRTVQQGLCAIHLDGVKQLANQIPRESIASQYHAALNFDLINEVS